MNSPIQAAVAGGGTVGLTCALLLNRRCGWKVALVERSAPRDADLDGPQRALTLSPGAREVLSECGVWGDGWERGHPALEEGVDALVPTLSKQVPCHSFSRMVVWRGDGGPAQETAITFDAAEQGVAALGYVVREAPLRRALWELAEQRRGIRLHSGAALASVRIEEESGYLGLEDGGEVTAELLVGADGAKSKLREALGIGFESQGYGQTGLVCEVECSEPGGNTAWQRFVDGGALALLPLEETRLSIVWSLPNAQAEQLQQLNEKDFTSALNKASASVAGDLAPVTPIASFPLRRGLAASTSGERYALVGEAARTVHPLAGQGLNLGLGDAEALARVCRDRGDTLIGDARLLGRFARERARYGHEMSSGIHAINAVFGGAAAPLAAHALGAVNRMPPVKRRLAARAMR